MSDFNARKKLLVAESEVYRELLKLEFRTFKVYGIRTRHRLSSFSAYVPLAMLALPFLTGIFRKQRRFSLQRLGSLFLLGWKTYRQFAPMFGLGKSSSCKAEEAGTAAEEYLSKRI